MNKNRKAATCLMLAIGLAAGPAQPQDVRKDAKSYDGPRMLKIIDPELLRRMADLASSAKTCDTETELVCLIEMKTLSFQGKDYCVAVAPEVRVKTDPAGGFFNRRRIVWKLDTDKLTGNGAVKDLAFHPDAGLVLTVNQHAQLDLWGKLGDGQGGPVQRIFFHTRTVRNKKDASATYLPVILWGDPDVAELCAAVDPKIVNV